MSFSNFAGRSGFEARPLPGTGLDAIHVPGATMSGPESFNPFKSVACNYGTSEICMFDIALLCLAWISGDESQKGSNSYMWQRTRLECVTSKFPMLRAPVSAWTTHDTVYTARGPLHILGLGMLGEFFDETRAVLLSRLERQHNEP